jgi:hypothetical protein
MADFLMWIPFGAALGCIRKITRHMARMLLDALAAKPSPAEWKRTQAYLSSYRLGLYVAVGIVGALIGAGIGALGFLFR